MSHVERSANTNQDSKLDFQTSGTKAIIEVDVDGVNSKFSIYKTIVLKGHGGTIYSVEIGNQPFVKIIFSLCHSKFNF